MRASQGGLVLALTLGCCSAPGWAQRLSPPAEGNAVLSTRFVTPLTYEAAVARLGSYYEEQLGRSLAFGCHSENVAPVGSWTTAMRPASKTSKGGASTFPPTCAARAAASSALDTEM